MSLLSTIRTAIATHAAPGPAMLPSGQGPEGAHAPVLAFPGQHHAAAAATPALAAALAAAPGSVSGGASGGMSGGVLGAIASPRPIARPSAAEVLDALADARTPRLDWRRSPADLLTLLDLDASSTSLRQLAEELGCSDVADVSGEITARLRGHLALPHPPAPPLRHAS